MEANDNKCTRYALMVEDVKKSADDKVAAETFIIKEVQNLSLNVEGSDEYYVQATLQSVRVHKCMGKHNSIEARIKIVQIGPDGKTPKKLTFSQTQLQDVFKNKKVELTIKKSDSKTFTVAENHHVYGVWPSFSDKKTVCYLDLGIYSWDVEMDKVKYSKCYTGKRLGADILKKMAEAHGHQGGVEVNMNVLKHEWEDKKTNEKKEIELTLPFLVQYNETEYEFMLRNANRCGEFFFFEEGKLYLGLKKNNAAVTVSDYSSLESKFSSMKESDSICYYNNAINKWQVDSKDSDKPRYVGEYSNEDYYEPFGDMQYESKKAWMEFNPPIWSRAIAGVYRMTNIASFLLDWGVGEIAIKNAAKRFARDSYSDFGKKYFNNDIKVDTQSWKYAKDNAYKKDDDHVEYTDVNYRYAQFSEYYKDKNGSANAGEIEKDKRMDANAFFEMRRLEEECAKNQYVLEFDSGQKEILLGSVLSIPDIKEDGKFLVVEIVSETEETLVKTVVETTVINPDGTTKKTTDTIDKPNPTDKMTVTVIPYDGSKFKGVTKTVPLPAEVEPIRRVGPQTAKVTDNMDPEHLDRVRVKFGWESDDEDATPWISVNTPWATAGGSGVAYKLDVGDEVMVDFEYGNAERPFVAGSRYNKDNKPPYGQRSFSTIIRSKNGHYIGFSDSSNWGAMLSSLLPGWNFFKCIPPVNDFLTRYTEKEKTKKILGGIEISDANGIYKISTSSGQRSIDIQSPFGTVNISAAMGITITAPNGNVKIVGKNVDIVAGNNLTLKSGTNIDNCLISTLGSMSSFKKYVVSLADTIASKVTGLVDIPAIRFAMELIMKPIAGTLKIHSGRYLKLECGGASAPLPVGMREMYSKIEGAMTANNKDATAQIYQLTKDVKMYIGKFKAYKQAYKDAYRNACAKRTALQQFMEKLPALDLNNNNNNGNINGIIKGWITGENDVEYQSVKNLFKADYVSSLEARPVLKTTFDSNVNRVVDEIKQLRVMKTQLSNQNWNPNIYNTQDDEELEQFNLVKGILKAKDDEFDWFGTADNLDGVLFIVDEQQTTKLHECVIKVLKVRDEGSLFSVGNYNGGHETDVQWKAYVNALVPKNQNSALRKWFGNHKWNALNGLVPLDTFSAYSWDRESKGEILISSKSGSVYTLEGDTLKRRVSASLEDLKDAMRMAKL